MELTPTKTDNKQEYQTKSQDDKKLDDIENLLKEINYIANCNKDETNKTKLYVRL